MPKKFIKKMMPSAKTVKEHKHLQMFGNILHEPNLWHLNRNSVATACSVGLFFAFVPIPFHMLLAAAVAIIVRCNLPIAVISVWFCNPLTMAPLFYFAFKLGALLLGIEPRGFHFELSYSWLQGGFIHIWKPFLLGCFVCGITLAIGSNILVRLFWRYSVGKAWQNRQHLRLLKQ